MKEKGFINYLVAIGVVLGAAFLSQQAFFKGKVETFYNNPAGKEVSKYLSGAGQWVNDNLYARVTREVQNRGEALTGELNKEKQNVAQSIGAKIKNYFGGVVDSVFNPGKNNSTDSANCRPASEPVCSE